MAIVLLADDDATLRDLVKRALTSDGHTVHVATDGGEALELSDGFAPGGIDLLVSDVDMPQLDGISLAKKALARHPGLAVVLMSGLSDQLDAAKGLATTKVVAVPKPFTMDSLRRTIQSLVS